MGRIPVDLRKNVATNIRHCRCTRYPNWGGVKKCAVDFGVSPQQWSQWERGIHMPEEYRMMEIARFFSVTTAYLRRDNSVQPKEECRLPLQPFAVRIENGIEVPLRVEVERMVYQPQYMGRMERIL